MHLILFLLVFVITALIVFLLAGSLLPFVIPLMTKYKINRPKHVYSIIWFVMVLLITCFVFSSTNLSVESDKTSIRPVLAWIVLIILFVAPYLSIQKSFHTSLTIFFMILIIVLLVVLIWEFHPISLSGLLLIPVLIWVIFIVISIFIKR